MSLVAAAADARARRALLGAPYRPARLARWGTELHDRFMLPHFIWSRLRRCGRRAGRRRLSRSSSTGSRRTSTSAFRCSATSRPPASQLELRMALEPWHVLGEESGPGGTARYVDSTVERIQVRVQRAGRRAAHVSPATAGALPLQPTGTARRVRRRRALSRLDRAVVAAPDHRRACAARVRRRRHLDEPLARRLPVPRRASRRHQLHDLPGQRATRPRRAAWRASSAAATRRERFIVCAPSRSTRTFRSRSTCAGRAPQPVSLGSHAGSTPRRLRGARGSLRRAARRAGPAAAALGRVPARARRAQRARGQRHALAHRAADPRARHHLQRLCRRARACSGRGRSIRSRSSCRPTNGRRSSAGIEQRADLLNRVLGDLYGAQTLLQERRDPAAGDLRPPRLPRAGRGAASGRRPPSAAVRRRPGALARRPLVGRRRPHAGAIRLGLRAGEPAGRLARVPADVPRPARCSIWPPSSTRCASRCCTGRRAAAAKRADAHRPAHAGPVQRDLLRARAARALSRLRAGRRQRPHGARRPRLAEDHRRPGARARDRAPTGRRLLRSARAALRLRARHRRPHRLRPARQRAARQRARLGRARVGRAARLPAAPQPRAARRAARAAVDRDLVAGRAGGVRRRLAPARAAHHQADRAIARTSRRSSSARSRPTTRDALRRRIARRPQHYVAQEWVHVSQAPVLEGAGASARSRRARSACACSRSRRRAAGASCPAA